MYKCPHALMGFSKSLPRSPDTMTDLQVVVWSALSYALHGAPGGLPRKVDLPDTWKDTGPWSVSRVGSGLFLLAQELLTLSIALAYFHRKSQPRSKCTANASLACPSGLRSCATLKLIKQRHHCFLRLRVLLQDLGKVPGAYIGAALLPALVITLLFFFDHSVSSQMAQQLEFRLEKPSAYHYDFFLLGIMTLACGLIGVPPVNGVLPQVP